MIPMVPVDVHAIIHIIHTFGRNSIHYDGWAPGIDSRRTTQGRALHSVRANLCKPKENRSCSAGRRVHSLQPEMAFHFTSFRQKTHTNNPSHWCVCACVRLYVMNLSWTVKYCSLMKIYSRQFFPITVSHSHTLPSYHMYARRMRDVCWCWLVLIFRPLYYSPFPCSAECPCYCVMDFFAVVSFPHLQTQDALCLLLSAFVGSSTNVHQRTSCGTVGRVYADPMPSFVTTSHFAENSSWYRRPRMTLVFSVVVWFCFIIINVLFAA